MVDYPRLVRRHFLAHARRERLSAPIYAAMVDHLFGTLVGFSALGIVSLSLAAVTLITRPSLGTLTAFGSMISIISLRTFLMVRYRRWRRREEASNVRDVVRWEISYEILGVVMMVEIGAFCSYVALDNERALALIISVIVEMGIAGCIAGRNGSRPKIVQHQLIAVFVPFIFALVWREDYLGFAVAALFILFGLAIMSSTRAVYSTLRTALDGERRNRLLSDRVKKTANRFDTALNNMTSGLLLFDSDRRLVVANEKVKDLMGRDLIEGMFGRPTFSICHDLYKAYGTSERDSARFTSDFRKIMETRAEDTLSIVDHHRGRIISMRLKAMSDGGVVFNVDDVTEQRVKDEKIFRLAHYDDLTGLPNRSSLAFHLEELLYEADERKKLSLMYLDLDRFKEVNDELGHAAGDQVLVEAARRLSLGVDRSDFVARLSGDEFVLVFPLACSKSTVEYRAKTLIENLSTPYLINGRSIIVGASAGLCTVLAGSGAAEEALRVADVALYEAKLKGRGQAIWFEPMMDDRARSKREMIVELRNALGNGDGLEMHYQPIFDAKTGLVISCEALMRWTHKVHGNITPGIFIKLAEEGDLIGALGRWALQRACADALTWDSEIKVAVNVSKMQFQQNSIVIDVRNALKLTGLPPSRLELEITESVLGENLEAITSELKSLAGEGISMALDDFGTGYSSLSLLHRLPFDKVKVDRSFIVKLSEDPASVNLLASIIQMLLVMRKQVIIEGVETAGQLALVTSVNGRFIQGFYYSRPLSLASLRDFLARTEAGHLNHDGRAGFFIA